ncbi:MAG: DUF2231 domain-containing protein [Gammaproteobacteria bacterium]|nr:DUF2231 domain-containing protein [Gammaproteobacteria bacterium]
MPLRLAGIPLHPAFVHYPIAAWTGASLFSFAAVIFDMPPAGVIAKWCNVTGLMTALPAMASGFMELVQLQDRQSKMTAASHMLIMMSSFSAYALMLLCQYLSLRAAALVMGTAGFILLVIGGHKGARLVYHFGIHNHTGANSA